MNASAPPHTPPDIDELYDVVRFTLRLARIFNQQLDEPLEQALGLNTKELLVLGAIMDGAQTPGTIATRQNLPAPTVTRIVSKLVDAGLVERATNAGDLRRCDLRLTAQGQATRARVRATGQDIVQTHFGHLSPDTIRAAHAALTHLHAALQVPGTVPA